MKKLVLAMVFILMMALFIAFNYLLWDRENRVKEVKDLEYENASDSADLSLRNKEIKDLEDENNGLQLQISQLESQIAQLNDNKNDLISQKDQLNLTILQKNDLLNALKQISDLKELGKPVEKWVEALNAGDYDTAYELEYTSLSGAGSPPDKQTYSDDLKNTVKSIALKSLKLDTDKGTASGEIFLDAELEVKLADEAYSKTYVDGLNERTISVGLDASKKEFVILKIS